jgi:hypothetical protein
MMEGSSIGSGAVGGGHRQSTFGVVLIPVVQSNWYHLERYETGIPTSRNRSVPPRESNGVGRLLLVKCRQHRRYNNWEIKRFCRVRTKNV